MRRRLAILTGSLLIGLLAYTVFAATVTQPDQSHTALTVTNLHSLSSSATAGWQSAVIDNRTTHALDYQVAVKLDMANTAPANDEAIYVYIAPAYYDGSNWLYNDSGTSTLPSGSEGTYTIDSDAGNLLLAQVIKYSTADQVVQATFNLGPVLGYRMVDGFSIILVNYSGAATAASGNFVHYKPIKGDVS